ncbi:MAG: DsbA family oxidoreductase, partial [Alphaproteobacteria bacterium]|nr:DsbA family oxidoreductase [Alphaproteobacteria bacterium]
MKIQIYSDTICPWCFVGKRRLAAALAQRPQLSPAIVWEPFQLNPDMAPEGADRDEYIKAKFGPGGFGQMGDALLEIGKSVGIDFDFDRPGRVPNTIDSHRMMTFAATQGLQDALSEVMFRQYFGEGLDISDPDILAAAGAEAGMDAAAVESLLGSDDGRAEIHQSDAAARAMGISGVPTFVFDNKYALVGAQEPAAFLELFDH